MPAVKTRSLRESRATVSCEVMVQSEGTVVSEELHPNVGYWNPSSDIDSRFIDEWDCTPSDWADIA